MEEYTDHPWLMGADGQTVQWANSTHPDSLAICAVTDLLAVVERARDIRRSNVKWTKAETERSWAAWDDVVRAILANVHGDVQERTREPMAV
jgi:hypothetical protein